MTALPRWSSSTGVAVCVAVALALFAAPRSARAQAQLPAMEALADNPEPGACPTCLVSATGQTAITFRLNQSSTFSNSPPPGAQVASVYLQTIGGSDIVINRLVLTHATSTADVLDVYTDGRTWYPTAQLPLAFPFAGTTFAGAWSLSAIALAYGLNPQLTVVLVVNWQVVVPDPPPPANPTIQGYKLDAAGGLFAPGAVITVDGSSTGAGNPYGIAVGASRSHTAVSSVPAGYWVAHSICLNCTSHPDASWAYGNSVTTYLRGGDSYDLWWKYIELPRSYLDTPVSHDGTFSGWAYDPFAPSASIGVDVWLDAPAGQGTYAGRVLANGARPDVDQGYGITGDHGFTYTLAPELRGTGHVVYLYAVAVNGHDAPAIGNIPGDFSPPGAVPYGRNVALASRANSRYVCADNAGRSSLIANRTAVGAWETFQVVPVGDNVVALWSFADNRYVTAESAGASALIANRTAIGPWEQFRVELR